jgi:hypothetical protein
MSATKTRTSTPTAADASTEDTRRAKSGVRFPYYSLAQSIEVARLVHERGGGRCSLDQLAAYLNQSAKSGAFLSKIAAARMFGLITNATDGYVRITERAQHIIAPTYPGRDDRRARVEAFEGVPLFADMLRHFGSGQLPPQAGMDNALEHEFHIAKSAVSDARRAFSESADQAGFFEARGARTHLVRPTLDPAPPPPHNDGDGASGGGGGSGSGGGLPTGGLRGHELPQSLPRAIAGMLASLPDQDAAITDEEIEDLVTMFKIAVKRSYKKSN